jgi:DNA-directed RNA polymerase specialized sigma24 family protein
MNAVGLAQTSSQQNFQRFLQWLSPDMDEAGRRHNEIHASLMRVFASRGCDRPEELADETLERVVRKIDIVAPGYQGNPAAYVYGVGKRVFWGYARSRRVPARCAPDRLMAPASEDPELERRFACLEACLNELTDEDRELILQYYNGERAGKAENRQRLAHDTQVSQQALRKRTQRIRERLKETLIARLAEPHVT